MFWKFISRLSLRILSLRYSIEVRGLKELQQAKFSKKGGILFLPNHSAHMDPLFLFILLWPKFQIRPLVVEYIYRQKFLRPLMRFVRALSVPSFDSVNQLKIHQAEKAMGQILEGIKKKENFILYPSGRLKSTPNEIIGGASATHSLIQQCPEANVVLVRTTGLWGSSFSRALEGKSPELAKTIFKGVFTIFKNLIFFAPRRKIVIEFEAEPKDFPREVSRIDFNRYLENWFNQYPDREGKRHSEEPLQLVPYQFWNRKLPTPFQSKKRKSEKENVPISEEIRGKIYDQIRKILENPNLTIEDEMNLAMDLGMDSLNIAEVVAFLASKFDIDEVHPEELDTVRSVLEIASGERATEQPHHQIVHTTWPKEKKRPIPIAPSGETLPEAFLYSCDRLSSFIACGDDLVGVLTYKKLKRAILVLAEYFRTLDGKTVAVLLPASTGAYITILALLLAKKVPVMLNWTLGPRYLEEMMKTGGSKYIISSWRFLDRLSHVDFGSLVDKMVLLEDIREKLPLSTKLKGAFLSMKGASSIIKKLKLNLIEPDETAVILFTSGTEAVPKGVPLSHKNILSNLRSVMHCIDLKGTDVIYGILPPFHSFGLTVAGIFALLSGMKIAFYPDPTDSFALAEGIERWKITLFCSTPSFMRGLFQAAKKGQLDTVRLFVSGAEKASAEIYEKVKSLNTNAKLIEGYGITECSPVLTLNRFHLPPRGVGHPLPDIDFRTIHPETLEPLSPHSEGEICVKGPNVFSGYLEDLKSPFIELDGAQWYRTGDIGKIDEDGYLILTGRLKRFTKIGGEMISLGAVEEILISELKKRGEIKDELPSIAVIADEKESGKPQLILFSTLDLSREKANEMIQSSGFSRLIKITEVRKIEEIPIMGTGKTNYRQLQSLLNEKKK